MPRTPRIPEPVREPGRPRGAGRTLARAFASGVATVMFFGWVEGCLALTGWAYQAGFTGGAAPTGSSGYRILAVGDSYTFGLGAGGAGRAYPARLQARLAASRPDLHATVVNGGFPGANSAAAERVARSALLAPAPPSVVLFLAGLNDAWNFAGNDRLVEGSGSPHRLARVEERLDRLRTYRALQWLMNRGGLGPWLERRRRSISVAAAFEDLREARDGDAYAKCSLRVRERGEGHWARLCQGLALSRLARYDEAVVALGRARALAGPGAHGEAAFHLAQALRRAGRPVEAERAVEDLLGTRPHQGWGQSLRVFLRWDAGKRVEAKLLAATMLAELPRGDATHPYLEDALAWMSLEEGRLDEADAGFNRALAAGPFGQWRLGPALVALSRGDVARARAEVARTPNRHDARVAPWLEATEAVALLLAGDTDGAFRRIDRVARLNPEAEGLQKLRTHVQRGPASLPRRGPILDVFAAGFPRRPPYDLDIQDWMWAPGQGLARALAGRVADLAALARDRGSVLAVMTYPGPSGRNPVSDDLVAAGRGADVPVIDHRAWTRDALERRPIEELFVADGHPNGEGYDLMAAAVLDGLAGVLPPAR